MTNGEKFKEVFGFGADGSRVISVNATWWDCEFQNSKPMNDELVKQLRERGQYITEDSRLLRKAADTIEELLPFKKQVEKGMGLLDKADELLNAIKPR